MSSYIVDNLTINRFLSTIYNNYGNIWLNKMGKRLLRMNIKATEQRYLQPYLTKSEVRKRIRSFKYQFVVVSDIQAFKSLSCFLYQCMEGKIEKTKLYRQMREIQTELGFKILKNLKEYENAEWG